MSQVRRDDALAQRTHPPRMASSTACSYRPAGNRRPERLIVGCTIGATIFAALAIFYASVAILTAGLSADRAPIAGREPVFVVKADTITLYQGVIFTRGAHQVVRHMLISGIPGAWSAVSGQFR
jgi:hypothetical protein